jgi:hypothetical protein
MEFGVFIPIERFGEGVVPPLHHRPAALVAQPSC